MISKILGICLLGGALGLVYYFESESSLSGALRIFHWPPLMLTTVGPFGLMLLCSDFGCVKRTIALVFSNSAKKREKRILREALVLQKAVKEYYSKGPQVFEQVPKKGFATFLLKMFDRLSNRLPTPDVRDFVYIERDRAQVKLAQSLHLISLGVKLTPSVGMLGTIMGMVRLLSTLDDPSKIGNHMSLALLTTFYGLFFSLAFWTPLQQKIEKILDAEMDGFNQALRWLELLEKRKPANYFADTVDHPTPQKKTEAA